MNAQKPNADLALTSSEAPCGIEAPPEPEPQVTRETVFSKQACVPSGWTDEQAHAFANIHPAGTERGWLMRKNGDESLGGCDERVKCEQRAGCVHIMFDC